MKPRVGEEKVRRWDLAGDKEQVRDRDTFEAVIFKLGDDLFGIDIFRVSEITRIMEITRVPRSLTFVEGIINLRGRIIPVVDLRKRLEIPAVEHGKDSRIIISRMSGFKMGLLVDQVTGVAGIPRELLEKVPPATLQIDADYIRGVGHLESELVIILDLDRILTSEEKKILTSGKKGAGLRKV
jgi:purine-binding chemotaxis protein CheW